jgi:hexosaminidase
MRTNSASPVRPLSLLILLTLLAGCSAPTPTPAPLAPTQTASRVPASTPTLSLPAGEVVPLPLTGVLPKPVSVEAAGGTFVLNTEAVIAIRPDTPEMQELGLYLARRLRPATGYALSVIGADEMPAGAILLEWNAVPDAELGAEGYQLTVTPEGVQLQANQPAGLFHAIQTLRQLFPAGIESGDVQPGPWALSTGVIRDWPRFAWRGTMLDVARHFFTVRDVTRYIDLLAYYKLNRLHLHLADDQGWRIMIESWPNLALYGGSLEVGGTAGGYYSQDDYAYIASYAARRFITIVPEIDMPGHVTAALASYPELNCSGQAAELYTGIEVGFSSLCIGSPDTDRFLVDVIGELAAITPGPYLHFGGDEAMATSGADYVRFVSRVQELVSASGKIMVGWEEIAQAPLAAESIAQHWHLDDGYAALALAQGMQVLMSPSGYAYLDMKYDPSTPLGMVWAGYIGLQRAYSWDPAQIVPGVDEADILGVEAPLWSETLETLEDVQYMAFPRLAGHAEIGWSPQSARNWEEYRLRLAAQGPRLDLLGVNYYRSPEIDWP